VVSFIQCFDEGGLQAFEIENSAVWTDVGLKQAISDLLPTVAFHLLA
jgi:hypothetical protein